MKPCFETRTMRSHGENQEQAIRSSRRSNRGQRLDAQLFGRIGHSPLCLQFNRGRPVGVVVGDEALATRRKLAEFIEVHVLFRFGAMRWYAVIGTTYTVVRIDKHKFTAIHRGKCPEQPCLSNRGLFEPWPTEGGRRK